MKNTKTIKFKNDDGTWGEPQIINLDDEPLMKVADAIKHEVNLNSTIEDISDLFFDNVLRVLFGEQIDNEYQGEDFLVVDEDRTLGGTIGIVFDVLDVNGAWDRALAHVVNYAMRNVNESKKANRKNVRRKPRRINENMEIQPDYGFVTNKPTKRHDYIITKEELDEVGSVIEQVLSQYINNKYLIDDNFEETVIDYLNKYKNKYDEIGVSRSKMVEDAIINTLFNLVSITGGDEVESIVKKLESEFGYTETFFSIYKIHHLKFFNNSLHYIYEKYFNDMNESRRINKLYTSINEFKSNLNYSDKKRRRFDKK